MRYQDAACCMIFRCDCTNQIEYEGELGKTYIVEMLPHIEIVNAYSAKNVFKAQSFHQANHAIFTSDTHRSQERSCSVRPYVLSCIPIFIWPFGDMLYYFFFSSRFLFRNLSLSLSLSLPLSPSLCLSLSSHSNSTGCSEKSLKSLRFEGVTQEVRGGGLEEWWEGVIGRFLLNTAS